MALNNLSLKSIFLRFRWKISLTWLLVVLEAGFFLLFPLSMGKAIDDFLQKDMTGLVWLSVLALLSLLVGAGRRYYDTRIYSKIYARISPELVEKEKQRSSDVSIISARANLATEFVEFLEDSFPYIIESIVGLAGTIIILFALNFKIFVSVMAATLLIGIIYALTSNKTYSLNSGFNEEMEKQVTVLSGNNKPAIQNHFKNITKWSIKLSDLETTNFSISWIFLMGVLVYSIVATIQNGITAHGQILAIVMYVFNYIEAVIALPLSYQQVIRLKEISNRLN
jgi:hypothetical protein